MRRRISFSLDKKLILLVLSVSLIAITATAALSLNLVDGILKEKIKAELVEESTIRGNAIKILLDNRIKEVFVLSSSPLVKSTVSELNQVSDAGTLSMRIQEKRIPVLVEIRNFQLSEGSQIELVDVAIFGKSLKEYFTLEDGSEFPPKERMLRLASSQLMEFVQDSDGQRRLIVAMPIKDEQNKDAIGVVAAMMKTQNLDRILDSREGLQETGEVYIVNRDRMMISKSIFVENAEFSQAVDTLPVSACFEEHTEVQGEVYDDYRGEDIFGISYCQSGYGYVVLTEMDENEVLQQLFDLQEKIIGASAGIMIAISAVAYGLSRTLSKPIRKLTDAAHEIAEGNFDVKTEIKTSDEIGELSHSFDTMARRLLESEIELSKQKEIIKQQEDILLQFSDRTENACVCFIDINESTKICSKLTDAETTSLYSGFINSMAAIIKKYNGIVVKNIGDALLFYFKIENVGEQGEFKNVLDCGLALIEHHDELCKSMECKNLPRIDYRLSITFGPVSMASVATSEVNDVFGSTVNLCSKINSCAEANGLVIGERMYEKVKGMKEFRFVNVSDFQISEGDELKIFSVDRA